MIILDASAAVGLILSTSAESFIAEQAKNDPDWVAPEHFTVEVASALRRAWLRDVLDQDGFLVAMQRLADLSIETWPVRLLLPRIAQLAANASAYDAAYLALAEHLDAPLLTADRRLSGVRGTRCRLMMP